MTTTMNSILIVQDKRKGNFDSKEIIINDFDFDSLTISDLALRLSINETNAVLMSSGKLLLIPKNSCRSEGLESGSIVYILKAPIFKRPNENLAQKLVSESEISSFFPTYTTAIRHANFSGIVRKITLEDNLKAFVSKIPGLSTDMIALAYLCKPEYLLLINDKDTMSKLAINHSPLFYALKEIVSHVNAIGQSYKTEVNLNPFDYHMDNLSEEDEEMEEAPRMMSNVPAAITSEQLAAAINAVQRNVTGLSSSQLMSTLWETQVENRNDYDSKIQTMREMGIIDEGLALRALTVMSGDLQAAINLIFSGWLGDDESSN